VFLLDFFSTDTTTTQIYTLSYTTLFRSAGTGGGVTLAIVVPVKSPRRAKHRLEPVLSEPEREQLAGVMAREVFAAVSTLTTYGRSEEHTSELQSLAYLVCRLLLEKKNKQ